MDNNTSAFVFDTLSNIIAGQYYGNSVSIVGAEKGLDLDFTGRNGYKTSLFFINSLIAAGILDKKPSEAIKNSEELGDGVVLMLYNKPETVTLHFDNPPSIEDLGEAAAYAIKTAANDKLPHYIRKGPYLDRMTNLAVGILSRSMRVVVKHESKKDIPPDVRLVTDTAKLLIEDKIQQPFGIFFYKTGRNINKSDDSANSKSEPIRYEYKAFVVDLSGKKGAFSLPRFNQPEVGETVLNNDITEEYVGNIRKIVNHVLGSKNSTALHTSSDFGIKEEGYILTFDEEQFRTHALHLTNIDYIKRVKQKLENGSFVQRHKRSKNSSEEKIAFP